MTDKTLYRISGVSAIVGTLFILFANLHSMLGVVPFAPGSASFIPEESLSAATKSQGAGLLTAWGNIYGTLLLAVAVIGIYQLICREGAHTMIPLVIFEIGAVVLTIGYLIATAWTYQLAPLYEQGVREAVYSAEYLRKILFEVIVVYGSWLTLGLPPLLFGLFGLKSANTPKWLNWLAIVGGALGTMEWLKAYPWQTDRNALVFINIILFSVWLIGMGVVMLRYRDDKRR